jgi:spore coat polysaccharide biosynthesis protein SpsF
MKVVAIIQARMGSTRLPGKVVMPLAGQPMLACQIQRTKRASLDDIVIATTTRAGDDAIVDLARKQDVQWFRGSEADVLGRFVGAGRQAGADVVVRLTADCPLMDGDVVDRVVKELLEFPADCDYSANIMERTYPRGLDVEAFHFDTLLRIERLAKSAAAREHVTLVPRSERHELFVIRSVKDFVNNADLRWTVDTPEDLDAMQKIFERLGLASEVRTYRQILAFVRAHPELCRIDTEGETWDPMSRAG